MKCKLMLGTMLVATLLVILPTPSLGAEEGAALYKSKCASCHGPSGEGKPAMKAPALKGTTQTSDQLVERITKGDSNSKAPHNKGMSSVNDAQAKVIAEFVKSLK
jgi:mono/diheme cytochrome c family protein